ncbi:GntR family transcriptional regulator [Paenisporosarcina indica]|uniref:GntR family transcriptional regulator n=1 Tax=Paenisporosarcina indica TaxID=650093 RepID=UPI000AAE01E4|nr:GntR family transcriptional regulator [Paenisporosarcina indica]
MKFYEESDLPIYIQVAEWLENEILRGQFGPDDKIYSQYQLADLFTINPATAGKGLSILFENDILYKKRGLGMFVTPHARSVILSKRKNEKLTLLVNGIVDEAERLEVPFDELIDMLNRAKMKNIGERQE